MKIRSLLHQMRTNAPSPCVPCPALPLQRCCRRLRNSKRVHRPRLCLVANKHSAEQRAKSPPPCLPTHGRASAAKKSPIPTLTAW